MKHCFLLVIFIVFMSKLSTCQDSTIIYKNQTFTLTEVVVRNNFNIASFIEYVKNDTTFYKAFRNLHIINFSAYNNISLLDKKNNEKASWSATSVQLYSNGCRSMVLNDEKSTVDFFDKNGGYNYTTAELYASLFLTKGKVCGETNIVNGRNFSAKGKSGMEKHKEQLKQLFFNPGTRIAGLPFIGNKVALFDEDVSKLYDYRIDKNEYNGRPCYVFTIKPRENLTSSEKNDVVIDEMTTWFDIKSLEIFARNYSLSYQAGVFNFDVSMQVQLEKIGDLLVPKVLRYNGSWGVIFKPTERARFTATLFDFSK